VLWGNDRGTVTAEIAIGIPAILGVIGIGLGALRWGMDAVAAVSVASESAIEIGRGADVDDITSRLNGGSESAVWRITTGGASVCVEGSVTAPLGFLPPISVSRCVNN
jgi:hypothetical protein